MSRLAPALAALLVACSGAPAAGTLTDGMSGQPIAAMKLTASAVDPAASLSCLNFEATTDAAGVFAFDGLCAGEYALKLGDADLWLVGTDRVPDGGAEGLKLEAWRAPAADGIFVLSGTALEPLKTSSELMSEKIKGSKDSVRYPARIPNQVPVVAPTDHLVLVGKAIVAETRLEPLVPSGARTFGDDETNVMMEPWSYIGVSFTDDKTYAPVTAATDASQVIDKASGERQVRYIAGGALPAGRYALYREGGKSVTVIDFGASQKKEEPPTADAGG